MAVGLGLTNVTHRSFAGFVHHVGDVGESAALGAWGQPSCLNVAWLGAEELIGRHFPSEAYSLSGAADDTQTAIGSQTEGGREIEDVVFVVADEANGFGGTKLGAQATRGAIVGNSHISDGQVGGGHTGRWIRRQLAQGIG